MVEHTAVNRGVVGSSPTRGVKPQALCLWFFLWEKCMLHDKLVIT